ncbi:hypothetical protein BU14_1944s0001 [Porphyra umbilicalis]|uniref:Uncharacterized protein n=1 Tax=Porphyra umbilicalis TaxID=2786 RepID=A0A1X6NK77_PORUM|nr:hypothetical protein BU14_1944s0001 [Porphyra umbilicalis]|eukprot:OSX69029.1 hypothetical protein BU14_1944s0001 [Porphyra umbilicalis]
MWTNSPAPPPAVAAAAATMTSSSAATTRLPRRASSRACRLAARRPTRRPPLGRRQNAATAPCSTALAPAGRAPPNRGTCRPSRGRPRRRFGMRRTCRRFPLSATWTLGSASRPWRRPPRARRGTLRRSYPAPAARRSPMGPERLLTWPTAATRAPRAAH